MKKLIDLVESTRAARLKEQPREHIGCSEVGHECERSIWLTHRWASEKRFSGRTYGILRRGTLEESVVIADLTSAGYNVSLRQAPVVFSTHFRGSIDGVIELDDIDTLLEIKALKSSRFKALQKKGVKLAEPKHHVQMQLYMLGRGLEQALYYVVNKDTDELHCEIVRLDTEFAELYRDRALGIIQDEDMPPPMANGSMAWYVCKMCDHHALCWEGAEPERSCRTCWASFVSESGWSCGRRPLSVSQQREGCNGYERV